MDMLYVGGRTSPLKTAWMRMVGSFFNFNLARLAIFVVGALVVCTGTLADSRDKYLAAAGPTPVRFQWDVPRLDPAKALPPLQMSDVVAASSAPGAPAEVFGPELPTSPAPEPDQLVVSDEDEPEQNLAPVTNVEPIFEPNIEPVPKQNGASGISPQMLLRYFGRNGTNEVLVPYSVDFTPPVRPSGSGSSAVYISE